MQYYNHEGKLVTYNEEGAIEVINSRTSNLYFFRDYIYKKYHGYTDAANRVTFDVFEVLDKIDNRHLLKITELLKRSDRYKEWLSVRDNFTEYQIDAYTMPIIKEDNIDLLNINVEYLFEMIDELQTLFRILSTYQIEVDDIFPCNIRLQENNIILIDWDKYRKRNISESMILHNNLRELVYLFYDLFKYRCKTLEDNRIIGKLFRSNLRNNESLSLRLKQDLSGCKTVGEYLNKW